MVPAIPFIFRLILLSMSAGFSQLINAGVGGNTTLKLLQRIEKSWCQEKTAHSSNNSSNFIGSLKDEGYRQSDH